jgi:hypothetical protein
MCGCADEEKNVMIYEQSGVLYIVLLTREPCRGSRSVEKNTNER